MNRKFQYISDSKGKTSAVIVPIEQWNEILHKLQFQGLNNDLQEAFEEVNLIRSGKPSRLSLEEVLNEI